MTDPKRLCDFICMGVYIFIHIDMSQSYAFQSYSRTLCMFANTLFAS